MKKMKLKIDSIERGIIINALMEFRNYLIKENRYHDAVDELLLKLCKQKGLF